MPDIVKLPDISRALDIDITEILGDGSSAQAIKKVVDNTPEPLTTKELIALAPMMPPAELREETEKIMDNEALDMVVDKAIESDSVSLLSGIGCFLEKKSIKKIVEYLVETKNISEISNFALFI